MAEGDGGGHQRSRRASMEEAERIRKGWMGIRVGRREGEEQRRFVVPVEYLRHPLFVRLLREAEEEFGFHHQGGITIPCCVDYFHRLRRVIDRDCRSAAAASRGRFRRCFRFWRCLRLRVN